MAMWSRWKPWHDPRTACWANGPGKVVWEGRINVSDSRWPSRRRTIPAQSTCERNPLAHQPDRRDETKVPSHVLPSRVLPRVDCFSQLLCASPRLL